ncbi:hypothetical protein Q7P37_002658 [Cladosporium fusiforme]
MLPIYHWNVTASTTLRTRTEPSISLRALQNTIDHLTHSFNYCFRRISTRSILEAVLPTGLFFALKLLAASLDNITIAIFARPRAYTMKYRIVATAAVAATGAAAQQQYGSSSSSPENVPYTTPASSSPAVSPAGSSSASYVTVTYDDCPSQSIETLITYTSGITVTYCPECHDSPITSKPGPSHTTVYTTVYQSLCSTGLVPVTYTVTEECEEPTPTWASSKGDHVPQGFTVTVKECHVCDKTPVPVTITEPCKDGCGKPKPKPTPAPPAESGPSGGKVSQIPDGQVQAPGPSGAVSQIPDGQVQAPGPSGGAGGSGSKPPASGGNGSGPSRTPEGDDEKCPGPQCTKPNVGASPAGEKPAPGGSASNGAPPPYPTGSSGTDDKCPGPQCVKGTDSVTKPANSGDTSNIEPYVPGSAGATVTSLGFVSSICMAAAVAVLAFAL